MLTFESLKQYYDDKYKAPVNDSEAIFILSNVYKSEMRSTYDSKIREGIAEVYRELQGKGLPAYYWMLESIHRTSKKAVVKHSFNYVVGTLRKWIVYGFGNTYNRDEEEVFGFFSDMAEVELTIEARQIISGLMGKYGAIKLMRVMPELLKVNKSIAMAEILSRICSEKFESPTQLSSGEQSVTSLNTPLNNQPMREIITIKDSDDDSNLRISYA